LCLARCHVRSPSVVVLRPGAARLGSVTCAACVGRRITSELRFAGAEGAATAGIARPAVVPTVGVGPGPQKLPAPLALPLRPILHGLSPAAHRPILAISVTLFSGS